MSQLSVVTECGRVVSCVRTFAVIAGEVHGLIVACVRCFSCWRKVCLLRTSRAVHRSLLLAAGALKATINSWASGSGHLGQRYTWVYISDHVSGVRSRRKKRKRSHTRHQVGIKTIYRYCSGLGFLSETEK